ncbi:MAG: damage-inducible protein CinA [Rhodospirillaceae bacterium]|nr:damage-inducible protein CinA [Rhodospirillaceae bacterium]
MDSAVFSQEVKNNVFNILNLCNQKNIKIVTAESCTGGLIAGCLTEVPGSSRVVEGGFVTYSNNLKNSILLVKLEEIEQHGAVSEEVARSMAEGALLISKADIAIACTGVAGPDGGTPLKPLGLVHLSCALRNYQTMHQKYNFLGDRGEIRSATINAALKLVEAQLGII